MKRLAWVLATWFGCGLFPIAPGTMGTLGALPLFFLVRPGGPVAVFATAAILIVVGIWASNVVVQETGQKDPQRIVIDEAAGVMLALTVARTPLQIIAAVVLFRLFDITKPFPARRAEKLAAGYGVVLDDVVAGIYAAILVVFLVP